MRLKSDDQWNIVCQLLDIIINKYNEILIYIKYQVWQIMWPADTSPSRSSLYPGPSVCPATPGCLACCTWPPPVPSSSAASVCSAVSQPSRVELRPEEHRQSYSGLSALSWVRTISPGSSSRLDPPPHHTAQHYRRPPASERNKQKFIGIQGGG